MERSPVHDGEFAALTASRNWADRLFAVIQFIALACIAVIASVCFVREVCLMAVTQQVELGELLMLFLYTEVVVMAKAAMRSEREVLITMPVAIAVVALARYMVVSPSHDPQHQILYAAAIFVLVLSLVVWAVRNRLGKERSRTEEKRAP